MSGVRAWLGRIGGGLGACAVALSLLGFAASPAGAQAWWNAIPDNKPEIQRGFLPVPSIATSLQHNGDPVQFTVVPLNDKGVKTNKGPTSTVEGMGAGKPDTPAAPTFEWANTANNYGKAVTVAWTAGMPSALQST